MDNVEKQLNALETEARALKIAYEQVATSMPVFTTRLDFTPTKNELIARYGSTSRTENDIERVVLTLDTERGTNTLATLELETNADAAPNIRRVPYKGGARWVITNQPRVQSGSWWSGNWLPTTYRFQVQSLVKGSLRAENMTS